MKSNLAKLSDAYGITLELTGYPQGEIREDSWLCVTYPVSLIRNQLVLWSGRYSQGIGHFDVKEVIRYTRQRRLFAWQNGLEKHGLSCRFKDKRGLVELLASFALSTKKHPDVSDVLFSCLIEGQADFDCYSFEDFASELGYNSDSIKAHKMFEECCATGRTFRAAFDSLELEQLLEAANEY